jgi:hypothetical protein
MMGESRRCVGERRERGSDKNGGGSMGPPPEEAPDDARFIAVEEDPRDEQLSNRSTY